MIIIRMWKLKRQKRTLLDDDLRKGNDFFLSQEYDITSIAMCTQDRIMGQRGKRPSNLCANVSGIRLPLNFNL